MMTSFIENVSPIISAIADLRPKSILDIGGGFGKFSLMAREALLSLQAEAGDLLPHDRLSIDCAESCRYFQELPYHTALYNSHFHGDARTLDSSIVAGYDLVLLIDVVEHWTKPEAQTLIRRILEAKHPLVLVSTPREVCFYKQEYYGKDCPRHVSQWKYEDFGAFPIRRNISNERSLIVIL
jgi:2-polyprenyl-3-methyl-5-hydroxy-6-metoxy-1,4-benzoquinol methylase